MNGYRSIIGGNNGEYTVTVVDSDSGTRSVLYGSVTVLCENNTTLNSDIVIGNNVNNCAHMLSNCTNFGANIYFMGTENIGLNVYGMLLGCNNSKQKNVYYNANLGNMAQMNIVPGYNNYTWTDMTNGCYCADLNLYLYNNYVPQ